MARKIVTEEDRESLRQYYRDWRAKNPEKSNANSKRYQERKKARREAVQKSGTESMGIKV